MIRKPQASQELGCTYCLWSVARSNLKRVLLILTNLYHIAQKTIYLFLKRRIILWMSTTETDLRKMSLMKEIWFPSGLLLLRNTCQNDICCFFLQVLLSHSAVKVFYVYDKRSDFYPLKLCWRCFRTFSWSYGMTPKKLNWVQFLARINLCCLL